MSYLNGHDELSPSGFSPISPSVSPCLYFLSQSAGREDTDSTVTRHVVDTVAAVVNQTMDTVVMDAIFPAFNHQHVIKVS